MTWNITDYFRYNDTRLYQAQLISTIIVGLLAILLARIISKKQINLSNEQIELAKRQFEVDCTRFAIDIVIQNRNEIFNKITYSESKLNNDYITEFEKGALEEWIKENLIGRENLDEKLNKLIEEYTTIMWKNPKKFQIHL